MFLIVKNKAQPKMLCNHADDKGNAQPALLLGQSSWHCLHLDKISKTNLNLGKRRDFLKEMISLWYQ